MKKIFSLLLTICIVSMCLTVPMLVSAEDTNLALGATATGSHASNNVTSAIDGSISTYWTPSSTTDVKSLTITLAKKSVLSSLSFWQNQSKNASYYSLYYKLNESDDWTKASGFRVISGSSPYHLQADLNGVEAQYIRIDVSASLKNGYIAEVEVMGSPVSTLYLNRLSSSEGTFTTSFDRNITDYKVQVEDLGTLPTLNYEAAEGATAQVTQNASSENGYITKITVAEGENTKEYSVQFIEYNWALPANNTTVSTDMTSMVDGDVNTAYYLKNATPFVATLEGFVSIDKIRVYSTGSSNSSNYRLSYSLDGISWTSMSYQNNCGVASAYNWITYTPYLPTSAKYVKFEKIAGSNEGFNIGEVEIYGAKITDSYTVNSNVRDKKVEANVTFVNDGEASVADKCYILVVYHNGELYDVQKVDNSSVSVAAGAAVR